MSRMEINCCKGFIRILLIGMLATTGLWRCAHITQPQGGPKDSLPPVVITMTPAYGTINFDEKKVYIEFNEYVQLKDQQKEFYTSPFMRKIPTISLKGRGIQIDIRDTLLPDQTYSLNFGRCVADNNEGNPYTGLRYVFSTGSEIDSLIMSGYSIDAYTNDTVGNVFLLFYDPQADSIPERDSTVFKSKPLAVGRAFPNGIYLVENLKPIDYRVYALEDNNGNQEYEAGVDRIAFLDSTCNPATMADFDIWYDSSRMYLQAQPQTLMRVFMDEPAKRQTYSSSDRPLANKIQIYFTAPYPQIEELSFDSIDSESIVTGYLTPKHDSMELWFDLSKIEKMPDTLKGRVIYYGHDTLSRLCLDTVQLKLGWKAPPVKEKKKSKGGEEETEEKERNPFSVSVALSGAVNPEKHIKFAFSVPLSSVDSNAIVLEQILDDESVQGTRPLPSSLRRSPRSSGQQQSGKEDSDKPRQTKRVPLHFIQDTLNIREWTLSAEWVPGAKYSMLIPAETFVNVNGEMNDTMRNNEFSIADPEKFGTILLNIQGKTPESEYIIQILDASNRVTQERAHLTSGKHTFQYIDPGVVHVKMIEDLNGNGKWDTGSLTERRQPERVELFTGPDGKEEITTKENWELEFDVDMAEFFSPITMERMNQRIDRLEEIRRQKIMEEWAKRSQTNNR